jgi:hypothetical protein
MTDDRPRLAMGALCAALLACGDVDDDALRERLAGVPTPTPRVVTSTSCTAAPILRHLKDEGDWFEVTIGAADGVLESPACGGSGPEAVVELELSAPAALRARVVTASVDTVLSVRRHCDEAATEVSCNDDADEGRPSLSLPGVKAGVYYVILDTWNERGGTATLEVTVDPIRPAGDD